ncbi:MAG: type II secretion system F family protein [Verrucomicrobia bacterium]|nr:type II secretion system F family protein [Verrucomicrobiota bacterium]
MAKFKVIAVNDAGKLEVRREEADNLQELEKRYLEGRVPLVTTKKVREPGDPKPDRTDAPLKQKVLFFRQLANCNQIGMDVLESYRLIESTMVDTKFLGIFTQKNKMREIVGTIRHGIEEGESQSVLMARYPKLFDEVTLALLRSGESSGRLVDTCEQIVTLLQRSSEIKREVRSVMMYPMIITIVIALMITYLMWQVVPTFAGLYKSVNMALPPQTQIVVAVSQFFTQYPIPALGTVLLFITLILRGPKLVSGNWRLHKFVLAIPIFGMIQRMVIMATFARAFCLLIESGIHIRDILHLLKGLSENVWYRKIIARAVIAVDDGNDFAPAFIEDSTVMTKTFSLQVEFGVRTSRMAQILRPLAETMEAELNRFVKDLKQPVESLMIMAVGSVVGFVLLAILSPIFNIGQVIEKGM